MADDDQPDEKLAAFDYERGEGRTKHRWKHDYAGFVPSGRGPIGKCHRSISQEIAEALLRRGVVEVSAYEDDDDGPPSRIYNVYRGVPYVAVETQPGRSYHGYPWRGRMAASVREALRSRAKRQGHEKDFEKWLKRYSEN